jgi:hypothetical protein
MNQAVIAPAAPGASDLLNGSVAPAAPPAAPAWRPEGMPVTPAAFNEPAAINARAEIKAKIGDRTFYETLKAERERGLSGPASQAWANLHSIGWPMAPGVSSQDDVNAQASARNEKGWSTFVAALGTQWQITPEQIAELRAGVVREDIRNIALQRRDAMLTDAAWRRRFFDGDRMAKEEWGKVVSVLGLRPVKMPS